MKRILRSNSVSFSSKEELDGSIGEDQVCTLSKCIKDHSKIEKDQFRYEECKRIVHHVCSKLPAYFIQLLVDNKNQKFICRNCVNISKQIADKVPSRGIKIENLQREVSNCEALLLASESKEKILEGKVQKLNKEVANLKKEQDGKKQQKEIERENK